MLPCILKPNYWCKWNKNVVGDESNAVAIPMKIAELGNRVSYRMAWAIYVAMHSQA